jgi:hypothetical protein
MATRVNWGAVGIGAVFVIVVAVVTHRPTPAPGPKKMTREEAYKRLAEMEKELEAENRKPISLRSSDELFDQLQREKLMDKKPVGAVPTATSEGAEGGGSGPSNGGGEAALLALTHKPVVESPVGHVAPPVAPPPVGSQEEFTALIAKAGYQPHANEPGYVPYFEAFPANEDEAGLPGKLRIVYILSDDKRTLYFMGVVRQLRQGELPKMNMDNPLQQPDDESMAKDLIAKLQTANPAFKSSKFAVRSLPSGMEGDAVMMAPTVVLGAGFQNISATPEVVKAAVAEMVLVLKNTTALWK